MRIIRFAFTVLLLMATLACAYAADVPTFSLASGDVTEAAVKMNNYKGVTLHTSLELTLTAKKQAELTRLTTANLGKKIRLVVNGKLWDMPIVSRVVTSRMVDLSLSSPEQGLAVAKTLLKIP